MKLYEITDNIRELQALAESGEISESDIKDTMDALDCEFDQKIEAVLRVRQSLLSDVLSIEREIERLTELKKAPENSCVRLSEYIKGNMLILEKDQIDLGIFKVTLKKPTQKLGEIDESKVPDKYFTIIPETKRLDKKALLKAVKENPIDGVQLAESERALLIK